MNGPTKNKGHKKDVVARKRLHLIIQSLVVIIFVSAAWLAQATQFNLQILVSDVQSRSPISLQKPFTAELEFGNETINLRFNNNIGKYVLNKNIPPTNSIIYEIKLQKLGNYHPRIIRVRLLNSKNSVRKPTQVYMSNLKVLTLDVPNQAASYIRHGQIDRALALLEAGIELRGGAATAVNDAVEANYAIALSVACERLGYATCEEAAESVQNLIKIGTKNPKIFAETGVTKARLELALRTALTIPIIEAYSLTRSAFKNRNYLNAATMLETVARRGKANPSFLSFVKLTTNRIYYDLGVAYLKADISEEKRFGIKNAEYLNKAKINFKKVKIPWFEKLQRNLYVTVHRLASMEE